jgi:hypothetical protein
MTDDTMKKRPQDPTKINIQQQHELQYWADKFGVTPERIRQAVQRVGTSPNDVEREVKRVA